MANFAQLRSSLATLLKIAAASLSIDMTEVAVEKKATVYPYADLWVSVEMSIVRDQTDKISGSTNIYDNTLHCS